MYTLFAVWGVGSAPFAIAEALNTQLPKQQEETFSVPVNIDIPQQPLANSLHALGKATGMSISFPNDLVSGKTAPEVRGRMTRQEALRRMLNDTGLAPKIEGDSVYIQKAPPKKEDKTVALDKVEVRAKRFYEVGPLPGLGLTKEEIPGNVQSISAQEIKEAHSLSLTDLMNRKLQSVTVNDYQGNPFQMDVQYRGFTAGPQIGTPQGLSVFLDGIRVNEPFGDVVNWDMIPMNALAGVDVFPGSNPIFGLNTLGGAFSMKTKDGFNNAGMDADVLTGSFGRKQLQAEAGWNNGTIGLFAAGNFFLEDGWRKNSPSKVNQLFTKASFRGEKIDLNFSTLLVGNDLTGNGLIPSEMYERNRNDVFTSPDETKNRLSQFQLSGSYFVNDTFTITAQVHRRNSKRSQKGTDVMTDYDEELTAKRTPDPSEQFTCLYRTSGANAYSPASQANRYGLPDYVVIPVEYNNPGVGSNVDFENSAFAQDYNNGTLDINNYTQFINTELPPEVVKAYGYTFEEWKNFREQNIYTRGNTPPVREGANDPDFFNEPSFFATFLDIRTPTDVGGVSYNSPENYFFSRDPVTNAVIKNYVMLLAPLNSADCLNPQSLERFDPVTFQPILVDGKGLNQPGVVEGTPTALITENQIDQVKDGVSLQLNWNLEKHKFMVGASVDSANADYSNYQRLGFLDFERNGYLDPEQAHPQFAGAFVPLANNNFEGTQVTQSVYFSETWTPVETLHLSASGRYNQTFVKNKIAARSGFLNYSIGDVIAEPDRYNVCGDTNGDGVVTMADCAGIPLGYRPLNLTRVLDPAETEKFSFYSFNPSLGVSWQAKESLNVYANWAKGTRVPSVIELGCAFDKTPTLDAGGNVVPRSLAENRQCTLPTSLSGDPFLPQIQATTYDVGFRGSLPSVFGIDAVQWNLGAFQTDLKDDIYFVAVGNGAGFFDSVGKTRRRGIEAGVSGKKDRWGFRLNYSLTDATFEDKFRMISLDNSSSTDRNDGYGQAIDVKPGSTMPGVSLHNLNATLTYDVTDRWTLGLTGVAHSDSYLRGNENNQHRQGVARTFDVFDPLLGPVTVSRPPTTNPGKVDGYATFNFQTSYRFNKEWTATMLVNNIFDKEYFSAGRLGRNPFSPSINGAIGPDGYNHNSGDWLSTNFIAPGAPRGVWFSLNWHFVPD
ncbi:TonB-dependent receptor domain-containing protein [Methylophilus flavus]|uniref:TonB-dependent receptor domain-containing protein n=1 Tax=Methylophilus flavus TaxID=640084 RepID=A0ABW3PDL5_9PROT